MGIGAAGRATRRRPIPLLVLAITRREDTIIHRAGRSNQARSLALRL
jgi:hypothetical protein